MKNALIVIDMQQGSFTEASPKHDAGGLVQRLNRLANGVRDAAGIVIFVQQDGPEVCCEKDNLRLGGIPLLTRGPQGLEPRPEDELQSVFDAAYGIGAINASTRLPGIRAVFSELIRADVNILAFEN